nr:hypothetical protein [Tanacetum cinerariifolium]
MACIPKDYDGKGGAIAYSHWIDKMELVQDMSGCRVNQKVHTRGREAAVKMTWEDFKVLMRNELCPNNEMQMLVTEFLCHAMVGAGHTAYTDRFHEFASNDPATIQSDVPKDGMLINEAIRNGSLRKNTKKKRNGGELSMDRNFKDDHK